MLRSLGLSVALAACASPHEARPDASPDAPADVALDAAPIHRGLAPITYQGGHTLASMRLVVIVAPQEPNATQLFAWCDTLVASQWWHTVTAEYGLGAPTGCVHVTGGPMAIPQTLTDAQMQAYVGNAIGSQPPDGETMYLLVLPPQVHFGGNCSYSGYHESYGTLGDGIGFVERCPSDLATPFEALTVVGSHEVVEAATDPDGTTGWGLRPVPGDPWHGSVWSPYSGEDYLVEVGDFCNSTRTYEGGFSFQRSFSNAAAASGNDACVPADPVPYYNTAVPQDWYPLAAGQQLDIPVTGWVVGDAPPWEMSLFASEHSAMAPPTTAALVGPVVTVDIARPAMQAGQTSQLHVTMGPAATSGMWRTWTIYSFRVDANGHDGLNGDDPDHISRVGVYVP